MHIAFLTPEYPNPKILHSAGIGTSIYNLATELVKQEHQVTVFVYSQNVDEVFHANGVTIQKIAHKKYKFLGWYLYRKHLQNTINKIVIEKGIQFIESPDWTGITAFMRLKCPIVIRIHGSDTYFCHLEQRKQKWKNKWFEFMALKRATRIIAVSEFSGTLTKKLFRLPVEIQTIYNGIDVEQFKPVNNGKEDILLYFGSIIRKKGVLELAEIYNKVIEQRPNTILQLVGKDVVDILEQKSTKELFLELLSDQAKKNIQFVEQVPYLLIQQYLANASVVVLPSFAEAFPMTWLEAMAMKKALVTSNIGWANELMIDNETGFIVNPKDYQVYADRIIQLLDSAVLRTEFGENARNSIISNFSKEKIVKKNIEFYKSVIDA
ncbi:Glycosyltransferase involved in cell wall bisynthesis [Lutibacter oricola]|uniref:Glycosyltransferase involved in cell wall bisynthesis n=1 Tax=Lutibacter oricola TaxID=762486 RepID=A0A1H2X150_9FLAO|nr:glycosyltransferase family 4 protein [Lutibacter oricola]SDW86521.1 Glycosyltransferase involved in cell wall bisynthesis [Lutibacter oricola]